MSGFFAVFDKAGALVGDEYRARMMDAIRDTGPDGAGTTKPRPFILLGHRKRNDTPESLSAVLPLTKGNCTLVTDLRLDNRADLLEELGGKDRGQPDSHLLLDAYLKWGCECVTHLLGEFSFALWDDLEQRLFCARDPLGDRILYYGWSGTRLVCSNEIRAVLAFPGIDDEVDELSIAHSLVRRGMFLSDTTRTMFARVAQLPPGHACTASASGLRTSRYWSIEDLESSPLPKASPAEHHQRLRAVLAEAVRCRLRGLRPVASHLSGGLDSSTVACVAAGELAARGERLICFSHVPPAGVSDPPYERRTCREEPFVEAVARQYPNITVHYVTGSTRPLLGELEFGFHYGGIAHPNYYNLPWWFEIAERARALDIGTLLTAVAGNLTISWGGVRAPRTLLRRILSIARERLRAQFRVTQARILQETSALRPDVASRLGIDRRLLGRRATRAAALGRGFQGIFRSEIVNRFGIESTEPLSDQRVVEYCLRAPSALFRDGNRTRMLVRNTMRDIVPDLILDRDSVQIQAADWASRTRSVFPWLVKSIEEVAQLEATQRLVDWQEVRRVLASGPPTDGSDLVARNVWTDKILGSLAVGRFLAWVADGRPEPSRFRSQSP